MNKSKLRFFRFADYYKLSHEIKQFVLWDDFFISWDGYFLSHETE